MRTRRQLTVGGKNSQQFAAFAMAPEGCAIPQSSLMNVTWSVSDTENVTISNAHDVTYGVAMCVNATTGPITVTATAPTGETTAATVSGTATLTCE